MSSFKVQWVCDLVDYLSPKLATIDRNIQKIANSSSVVANRFSQNMDKMANKAKQFSSDIAPISIAVGGIGIAALKSAANFETLEIQLEVLLGSAEKGAELFKDLKKYAAETPFQLPEITEAAKSLLGVKIPLEQVLSKTKMLGDIAAASSTNIHDLAISYGKIVGRNKFQAEGAELFVSKNIPIWNLLEKITGKSSAELAKLASLSKISYEMFDKALLQATQKNGMYYQATNKLSKSLGGIFSTLTDNVNLSLGELGKNIAQTTNLKSNMVELANAIDKITTAFAKLSPETKQAIIYGGMFVGSLLPLGLAVAGISSSIKNLGLVISLLFKINPWILWITTIATIILNFDTFIKKLKEVWQIIKTISIELGSNLIAKFINKISNLPNTFKNAFNLPSQQLKENNINQISTPKQSFNGGIDVNFSNLPKQTLIKSQSTPNFNLGINSTYAL